MGIDLQNIVVLGSGNVAWHMAQALHTRGLNILQIYSPTLDHAQALASLCSARAINDLYAIEKNADLYILSIPDDAIGPVANELGKILLPKESFIVHTSGTASLKALSIFDNKGVFYPLQSFSKNEEVDFDEVPFCIEASSESCKVQLMDLARKISSKVYLMGEEERAHLHVAAVMVNNFVNQWYEEAYSYLNAKGLSMEILHPLMKVTVSKALKNRPLSVQTGPARRADQKTIHKHLDSLDYDRALQALYEMTSKRIIQTHKEKGPE